jgi:hypothetical protein
MLPETIEPGVRSHLLNPEIMMALVLWLMSEEAVEISRARFVAQLLDSSLPAAQVGGQAREAQAGSLPLHKRRSSFAIKCR